MPSTNRTRMRRRRVECVLVMRSPDTGWPALHWRLRRTYPCRRTPQRSGRMVQYATIIQIVTPSSFCRADLGAQPAPLRYTRQNKLRLRTFSTPLIYCLHAMPQLRAPSASSCLCRTILQHLDDFEELISQLPGPSFAELVGKAAIVPKRFFRAAG
jgi:hypothetical protein